MKSRLNGALALLLLIFVTSVDAGSNQTKPAVKSATTGMASWYRHGKKTANGESFKPAGLSAAHRTLPFNTTVLVTNLKNHKSVKVRINDRGPFIKGRLIDLSQGAAKAIGLGGVGMVSLKIY
jgi:rare lipoprotein A